MNKAKHIVLFSLMLLLPTLLFGQNIHELLIPKPTTGSDFLNDKIMGDTLANGARKDLDRIYVLERGIQSQPSIYFLRTVL